MSKYQRPLPKKSKYKYGDRITSLNELVTQDFIIFSGRVYHIGWVLGWQLNMCNEYIKKGSIYKAVRRINT